MSIDENIFEPEDPAEAIQEEFDDVDLSEPEETDTDGDGDLSTGHSTPEGYVEDGEVVASKEEIEEGLDEGKTTEEIAREEELDDDGGGSSYSGGSSSPDEPEGGGSTDHSTDTDKSDKEKDQDQDQTRTIIDHDETLGPHEKLVGPGHPQYEKGLRDVERDKFREEHQTKSGGLEEDAPVEEREIREGIKRRRLEKIDKSQEAVEKSIQSVKDVENGRELILDGEKLTKEKTLEELRERKQELQTLEKSTEKLYQFGEPEPEKEKEGKNILQPEKELSDFEKRTGLRFDKGILGHVGDVGAGIFEVGGEIGVKGIDIIESGEAKFQEVTGINIFDQEELEKAGRLFSKEADVGQEITDLGEDVQELGVLTMSVGHDFGEDVEEGVAETDGKMWTSGLILEKTEKFLSEDDESVPDYSGASTKLRSELAGGAATLGTQAGGYFTAGAGAGLELSVDVAEEPVETSEELVTESLPGFAAVLAREFAEDPVEFVAEETGEEVGEGVVGFAFAGVAGGIIGLAPNIEIEPEIEPDKIIKDPKFEPDNTPGNRKLLAEDLPSKDKMPDWGSGEKTPPDIVGSLYSDMVQSRSKDVSVSFSTGITVSDSIDFDVIHVGEGQEFVPDVVAERFDVVTGPEDTANVRVAPTEPEPEGGRSVESFRGEQSETGFTEQEQEIIREKRGREDIQIFQDPETGETHIEAEETASGPMILSSVVPIPVSPEVMEPEKTINPQVPDKGFKIDELGDVEPEMDMKTVGPENKLEAEPEMEPEMETEMEPEMEPEIKMDLQPVLDPAIKQGRGLGLGLGEITTTVEFQVIEQEFEQETEFEPEMETEPEPEPEPDPFVDVVPEPEPIPEPEPETRSEVEFVDIDEDTKMSEEEAEASGFFGERGTERKPSLNAILFGIEVEEEPEGVLTGLETRPVVKDRDL